MGKDRTEPIIPAPDGDESFTGNTHSIPRENWIKALPEAIRVADSGDRIMVHSESMQELGERALARMSPNKSILFIIEEPGQDQNYSQ